MATLPLPSAVNPKNEKDNVHDQIQNQLYCKLIAMNTPHFEYEACLFSREHTEMTAIYTYV